MTVAEVIQSFEFLSADEKAFIEGAGFHDGHVDSFKVMEHFIIKGQGASVTKAIENGISVDLAEEGGMGSSLLQIAIRYDQKEIFEHLITAGANIDFIDLVGWTPLMESIIDDKVSYGKRLVELGCDVNIANKRGATAGMLVKKFGRQDFMSFL